MHDSWRDEYKGFTRNKMELELLENGPKSLSQSWHLQALYSNWKDDVGGGARFFYSSSVPRKWGYRDINRRTARQHEAIRRKFWLDSKLMYTAVVQRDGADSWQARVVRVLQSPILAPHGGQRQALLAWVDDQQQVE